MQSFYDPNAEQLTRLDSNWVCAFSGGKDSTSLVTWMEYLRRSNWLTVPKPKLLTSDTGVEYPFLQAVAEELMGKLKATGWRCKKVVPLTRNKLYCQIFGRGMTPVNPGYKRMRWCTSATKVGPMLRFKRKHKGLLTLTGLRWGESKIRDEKLLKVGCSAGGECGIPSPGEDKYSPIINWTDCQVVDWLNGEVRKQVRDVMGDLFETTAGLAAVYNIHKKPVGLEVVPPRVTMLRFGCVGCPAIATDKVIKHHRKARPELKAVNRLYQVWDELRKYYNRACRYKDGKLQYGPIKMEVRKQYLPVVLTILKEAGMNVITEDDLTFIHDCWEKEVYPRGWSKADEETRVEGRLF
jgi:DNA sulfur modification protein DndC